MIISASRRTDIPAWYAPWLMNRIRAGFCSVPNPFNPKQVAHVSLRRRDVDAFVFWTRYPAALMPHLPELESRGYPFYFQFTLMDNPAAMDPGSPSRDVAIGAFKRLSDRIGPERVVWRYDPLVFSGRTGARFHCAAYRGIARELAGFTKRSVISTVDVYRKNQKRLEALADDGIRVFQPDAGTLRRTVSELAAAAGEAGMRIESCAETADWTRLGVAPGRCVDDRLMETLTGRPYPSKKDPGQRKACGCVLSRDIGMYDSCPFGCVYCYGMSSGGRARRNWKGHDPSSPSLIGLPGDGET